MRKSTGIFLSLLFLAFILIGGYFVIRLISERSNLMEGTLVSLGESRSYLLYVPDSYDTASPVPLVITLHGYSGQSKHVAALSRWNELADEAAFIVVYPQGTGDPAYWHSYGGDYTLLNSDIDVQFISDLIDRLEAEYTIDPTRIYVNGISMGGGMTYLLACRLADRIAAIGSVAGAYSYPLDLCHPSRPVPFIAFHGTADSAVPYDGEEMTEYGFTYPAILQYIQGWAELNQCSSSISAPQEGEISTIAYTQCEQNAEVILYTIHSGGHTWPGSPMGTRTDLNATTQQIDATLLMWEFFKQHPMPAE